MKRQWPLARVRTVSKDAEGYNKAERAYEAHLATLKLVGEIAGYWFHAIRVRLAALLAWETDRDWWKDRAEKAEAERDGLAATVAAVRAWHCGTVTEAQTAMGPAYQPLINSSDEEEPSLWDKLLSDPEALLAARDARIRAEGRKAGLLEAIEMCEESGRLEGNPAVVGWKLRRMAEEFPNG